MKSGYFSMAKSFLLCAALLFSVTGCGGSGGSGGSSSSSGAATTGETGSIAVKLVWSNGSAQGKSLPKVLYAAPTGVVTMRFIVSGAGMTDVQKDFPAADGSGVIPGIPSGSNRAVKAQGLDAGGAVIFQGTSASNITIVTGQTTTVDPIAMVEAVAPTTTASPIGGTYNAIQSVTLTANETATIYYTTNGSDPDTNSTHAASPITNILISVSGQLKFFAIDSALNQEATKTETYTINAGSLTVSW